MQPCGGAIPLCMVDEFDLPADIIDRKVTKMKMISPSNREVDVGKTLSQTEYIGAQLILGKSSCKLRDTPASQLNADPCCWLQLVHRQPGKHIKLPTRCRDAWLAQR